MDSEIEKKMISKTGYFVNAGLASLETIVLSWHAK